MPPILIGGLKYGEYHKGLGQIAAIVSQSDFAEICYLERFHTLDERTTKWEAAMHSLKIICQIPENRCLTIHLPEEIQPGEHELLLVIDQLASHSKKTRKPGSAKGKLVILSDDQSHLDDFKDYMP